MKRKPNRKALLAAAAVGVSLLVALLGYLTAISPQRATAADLTQEIETAEQTILEYRQANRNLPKPIKFAELFALTKAMPDDDDLPGVLLEVSRVADDTGIAINSITPRPEQPGTGFSRLPMEIVFQGSFYDLSDFLYRLRTLVSVRDGRLDASGRLFTVDSLNFVESEKKFPQLQATLTLTAFVYSSSAPTDGATAAASPTPPPAPTEGAPTAVGATN